MKREGTQGRSATCGGGNPSSGGEEREITNGLISGASGGDGGASGGGRGGEGRRKGERRARRVHMLWLLVIRSHLGVVESGHGIGGFIWLPYLLAYLERIKNKIYM